MLRVWEQRSRGRRNRALAVLLVLGVAALAVMLTTARTAAHSGDSLTLDQSNLSLASHSVFPHGMAGQSFTAGLTGQLARIDVGLVAGSNVSLSALLIIYEGGVEGGDFPGEINGAELHSETVSWSSTTGLKSFDLTSHVTVIAGRQYTWELKGGNIGLNHDTGSYAGGRSLYRSAFDHKFQTFVVPALVVTTTDDHADGACDGDCSLRDAIIAANAAAGGDTISLPAGTYTLSITSTPEDLAAAGDLDITDNLVILGAGAADAIIDGGALDRVFEILSGNTVEISGVTIRNGAHSNGGGIRNGGTLTLTDSVVTGNTTSHSGGGIYNVGTLVLNDSTVSDNVSSTAGQGQGPGGGIYSSGALTLNNSAVLDNRADRINVGGGGVLNTGGSATLDLNDSLVAGNYASHGGGVYNFLGTANILRSTITSNTGNQGVGIMNDGGAMTVTDSTISNHAGGAGAGIQHKSSGATITITNSTINGNSATNGAAIYNRTSPSTVHLINTTIAGNDSANNILMHDGSAGFDFVNTIIASNGIFPNNPVNCGGTNTYNSFGHNLADDQSCNLNGPGDIVSGFSLLGPLAYNGGPTATHALFIDNTGNTPIPSPAIDAGDDLIAPAADQRGFGRVGGRTDIGSYEFNGTAPANPGPDTQIGSCSIFDYPGQTHFLVRSIATSGFGICFSITGDDITLDGNGFTISGGGTGVKLDPFDVTPPGQTASKVTNLVIEDFSTGIDVFNSDVDNVIEGNALNRNVTGLAMAVANSNQITANTFDSNVSGILLGNAHLNTFTDKRHYEQRRMGCNRYQCR